MSQSIQEIKCIGCGAVIQTEDRESEGYIPVSALEKADPEADLYCQRCFRLRHYNDLMDIDLDEEGYKKILDEISSKKALIVLVVDLFDFEGTFIEGIQRYAFDNPIIIVGNKFDLLPQSVKESRIRHWVMMRSHALGVRPEEVFVTSATKKQYVKELTQKIDRLRRGRDVYVLGASNVGKSTLINQMIAPAIDDSSLITTSYFPGTTLGKIEIPLDGGSYLIDTPGIIQKDQVNYFLKGKDLKQVTPKKRLNPKAYQLNAGQSLFLGGLGRIDLISSREKSTLVIYASEDLYIHRTKTEKAVQIIESMVGRELTPPSSAHKQELEYVRRDFKLKEKSDVLISGLGWVTAPADVSLSVYAPEGINVTLRPAMI